MTKKCRKRGYSADFIEYDGTNYPQVSKMLEDAGAAVNYHNEHEIIIRSETGIETLREGDFIVRGENGRVKTYVPASFHAKYEITA
jgi:hypothetical protein